ncbi:MAG: alginate O-acetyltransferase complex protein AlgI [Glaciecola sp.]|jgi:alginate O-acetyltransferase complex protein AlgI
MLFNSFDFLLFLPIVLVLFYITPYKIRPFLLLVASYYFYSNWNAAYLILIVVSSLVGYLTGVTLSSSKVTMPRKLILWSSISINLGLLIYFKYAGFIFENINFLADSIDGTYKPIKFSDIILPIGISFYTFQILSYSVDVYHKRIKVERNPIYFALYVSFFPQLIAGPIERFSALTPQFKTKAFLNKENLSHGARLILYGFFMKMVVADNLAIIVDHGYGTIESSSSVNLLIVSILYSFQIYCDFHGYSTIAIGVAKLFNIDLTQNFRTPYFSRSLTSFWRNWHITLTNFFRDYIYYPMGGNKQNKLKWVFAVLVVFVVSGIWHGASWTFLIWGGLHGLFTLIEKLLKPDVKGAFMKPLKVLFTFLIVTLLWILFRSPDLNTAKTFYYSLLTNWNLEIEPLLVEPFILLLVFIILELFSRKSNFATQLNKVPVLARWTLYFVLIFAILSRSGADTNPFIYFQF